MTWLSEAILWMPNPSWKSLALGIRKTLNLVFVNSKGEDEDVLNAVERYRMAA